MLPSYNKKDVLVFCQVLRQMSHISDGLWRRKEDLGGSGLLDCTKSNYDRLIVAKHPTEERDLDGIESDASRHGTLAVGQFYMPPLDGNKDFVPLLWVECDFRTTPAKASFRVGMYRFLGDGKPQCFGLRFEMHAEPSNHNYCHMQITPRPHTEVDCDHVGWIPCKDPHVLLPAKDPVSLILCMLVSFYGMRISETMISPMNIDKKYKRPLEFLGSLTTEQASD